MVIRRGVPARYLPESSGGFQQACHAEAVPQSPDGLVHSQANAPSSRGAGLMGSVELNEDAVRIENIDAADVAVRRGEGLDGTGQLHPLVQQFPGQTLDVGDAEGNVTDSDFIQLDGLAAGSSPGWLVRVRVGVASSP